MAIQILRELPETPSGVFFPIKSKHSFNSFWRKVLRDAELKRGFHVSSVEARGGYDLKRGRLDDRGNIGARWVVEFVFVKKIHAHSSQALGEEIQGKGLI